MPLNNLGYCHRSHETEIALLWRCAQPDLDGLSMLQLNLGVKVIVKLNHDDEFPDELERENFKGDVVLRPLPRLFRVPSAEDLVEIVQQIKLELDQGNSVAVHCTHGIDRTGLVIGAFRRLVLSWDMAMIQEERRLFGAGWLRDIPDHQIVELLESLSAGSLEG